MSKDGTQEGAHGGRPTGGDPFSSGASDFEDSFLRELRRSEPLHGLPLPGEWLGGPDGRRYHILAWMGGGGMGQVFRARDETLQREVALKFLLPRSGFEAEALREARAVARLDHENIVRIFDVSEWKAFPDEPGVPFLVMECLEGEPLSALLKRGRLEARRALEVLDGIAAGLAHAHERGLVHRDLKPGNVFLSPEGTVKLLDFGLSHFMVASDPRVPHLAGAGTPAYMAPEQWGAGLQDARTDVWAAGVVLYEMLTGELPFPRLPPPELRERVMSPEAMPPVRARNPEVPPEVEALLATALAKEPARRFPTARELRRELHELRARLGRPGFEESGPVSRQRRQLVLLSCQLTGLEGLTGRLDAEDLGELQAGFHQECEEVIRRHGGGINLSMGGEVFACFGCTQVREDDAERAVRAALLLAHVVPESLQRRLSHLSLSGLGTKVGLHTDQMVLDTRALQGEAPRVVSWLARRARPGEVLASEATWGQVRGAFETERLGARDFVGLTGPTHVEVHRVLREREVRVRFERTLVAGGLTPLVGRERELRQLLEHWERAREGRGAFVLVRGEAGIGKSRLLEELRERVPPETALRLRFQCWSRLGASALPPVVEVLQQLLPLSPGGSPQLGEVEARLVAMGLDAERVQLLALLLSLPVPKSAPVYRFTPERRMEESYKALVELLLCVARRRPVLAVVEDLHWADSSWLEFLGWLLERVEAERLLVVLSARPEFQSSWPARPGFHPLTLERLPAGLAAALVKEVAKGSELPEATVQHLVEKTDGIPLFIEEMTRMALAGGEVASIPVTLHELLLARLDLLPSRQKALAQLGAGVGRDFSLALLAGLTEREPTDLRRELAGLVDAGLLQEVREGPDAPGYQFRHALFQEAAYQSLPRGERRAHHRHIARVLEERFPTVVEARPEALAHHLTEAGEHARALGYWERAGQLALLRQALPEAMGHLTRALELLPALADAEQRLQRELKIRVSLFISMAEVRGFGAPEVERMTDRVWDLIERVGEALPQLDLFYWGIFAFYWLSSRYPQGNAFAERLLDLGQRQGNPALLGLGHRMRATLHFSCGRLREAAEEFEHTLEGMEPLLEEQRSLAMEYWGEPRTLALAFTALVHAVLGRVEASRRYGQEALDRAGRVAHPYTLNSAQVVVAMACATRRDAREALALADRALEISSTRGTLGWRARTTLARASALSQLGRPREGLALALGWLEALRAQGLRSGVIFCLGIIAMSYLALGQVREALASVDEALVLSAATGDVVRDALLHQFRGECLRRSGREEEARACFVRALSVAHEQGAGLFELRATVSLCRQLRDTGSTGEARRLLEEAVERFAPGGDCVDLQEARALLAGLAGGGGPPT